MSFSFFKPSRARSTPAELVKAIRDSILALDTKTAAKALEDVEKNIISMRQMLSGDGETEPSQEQISQIALEICKEDVLSLFVQKLPSLGWDARKDLVHCWGILLRQKVDSTYCCVEYIENHLDLLDFLIVCYNNKEIALNCGSLLRECIKYPTLTKYVLESTSFELFFKYVELPNFDIASDALATFKELLTKHEAAVSQFLSTHYEQFFELYDKLLLSPNYVTKRQSLKLLSEFLLEAPNSQIMKRYILEVQYFKTMMALLKDSSKNVQILAFHIFKVMFEGLRERVKSAVRRGYVDLNLINSSEDFGTPGVQIAHSLGVESAPSDAASSVVMYEKGKALLLWVFVANPNKPSEIKDILARNHQELLMILHNLPVSKAEEDDQFEEEREIIIEEIEKSSRMSAAGSTSFS